jgi:hypothetical protein
MELFLRFSGILAMFFAWLFVVTPAIRSGIDSKSQTITSATKKTKVRRIVSAGLIIGTVFQIVFLVYLTKRFQLHFFDTGCLMYLSTNIATLLVALFTEQRHSKLHGFFAMYYFIVNPFSLILICLPLINSYFYLFVFSVFIVLLSFSGSWWLLKKYGKTAVLEQWIFLTLSIWTIVLTLV